MSKRIQVQSVRYACLKVFHKNKPFLICTSCDSLSHMGEKCSGLSRTEQSSGIWCCRKCHTSNIASPPSPPPQCPPSPISSQCSVCRKKFQIGKSFLSCQTCIARSHMGEKCSGLSRTQQAIGYWSCSLCSGSNSSNLLPQSPASPTANPHNAQSAATTSTPSPPPPLPPSTSSSPDRVIPARPPQARKTILVGQVVGDPRTAACTGHKHCCIQSTEWSQLLDTP